MTFESWFKNEEIQGSKQLKKSPKPMGGRSISVNPAKPANLGASNANSVPKYFSGIPMFGPSLNKKSKVIDPNRK